MKRGCFWCSMPAPPSDVKLRDDVRAAALQRDAQDEAFALLESKIGSAGIDILYDIAYGSMGRGYPQAAARARRSLSVGEVRDRATPALAVLLEFRETKTCDGKRGCSRAHEMTETRGCWPFSAASGARLRFSIADRLLSVSSPRHAALGHDERHRAARRRAGALDRRPGGLFLKPCRDWLAGSRGTPRWPDPPAISPASTATSRRLTSPTLRDGGQTERSHDGVANTARERRQQRVLGGERPMRCRAPRSAEGRAAFSPGAWS
jgi:hypothetical protein